MDILDILVAKNQSFTAETAKLTKQAKDAMAKANEVTAKIDEAQEALDTANAANERAQEVADQFDEIVKDFNTAASNIIDDKITSATSSLTSAINEAVTDVDVVDENTASVKVKKTRVRKKGIQQAYDVMKNYTTTGQNEDGGMTQKAITNALASQKTELENKIKNIPSGGNSDGGNVSGNFDAEDAGQFVVINESGNLSASNVSEEDIIKLQISTGTLSSDDIIGIEIDYGNKTVTRLQGAVGLNAGADFNKFNMYGGRKRCIVNENGEIVKFLTTDDLFNDVEDQRIMVYQPVFYYYRVPIIINQTSNGIKIVKEQLFLSDIAYGGFKPHPLFKDENNNTLKYVLLPAYECSALRANGTFEKSDTQDINFTTDKLVSIVNSKPITGYTQGFNYTTAAQMAENNGEGWRLTDLRYESLQQMLMIVEFASLNIQNSFNQGVSTVSTSFSGNRSCLTGSTHSLLNVSGQASSTTNVLDTTYTYTNEGLCSVSYRGVENYYGNVWRLVGNTSCDNYTITYNNEAISFNISENNSWINAFGYDANHDWVFLPIETGNGASSSVPVGDFLYTGNSNNITCVLAGGLCISRENTGIFYYACDNALNSNSRSISAQVMHLPTANSSLENTNYTLWTNS